MNVLKKGLLLLAVFPFVLASCENDDDVPNNHWVAPTSVNGTWLQDKTYTPNVGYCMRVFISQIGTNATVRYWYECTETTESAGAAYPATYDFEHGLLTVYFDPDCFHDYFRFTSGSRMYRVSDPASSSVHGVPFDRE